MKQLCLSSNNYARRIKKSVFLLSLVFFLWAVPAFAVQIDLNDFFFFPGDPVTVVPDGSAATIGEDPFITPITLTNDPGLGDPEVIVAGAGTNLYFDYYFFEGTSDIDEFGAFILDAATGLSIGPGFEFFIQDTSSGTVGFDLTSLVGQTLGLQFQLLALFDDFDYLSTVEILNVRLEVVPEPNTFILLGFGFIGLSCFSRKKFFK